MKWIGQHIYDLISRFRDDVYLESVSSGTIASGGNLGLDSNNKIVKATEASGDLTAIVVGSGLVGEDLSGPIPELSVSATLAGLTSLGHAGATTNIVAGDVTMYNTINDGNPTISLGSSATNRLEIASIYNSGGQTLDVVTFTNYSSASGTNDGRFQFYVDEVLMTNIHDTGVSFYGSVGSFADDAQFYASDSTTSSATQGGKLILQSDDGVAMGAGHRLGVIEFKGAEDASNNRTIGARIEAMVDSGLDDWSPFENGGRLDFYTTDGNASESKVLTLDSDKLATFTGAVTVTGALTMPDDTVTFAKASGVTPNVFGSNIKLIPSDFAANDDGGNTKFGVGYVEHASGGTPDSDYGMRPANSLVELFAFVSIPEGMIATHVMIHAKGNYDAEVFEAEIDGDAFTSRSSGGAANTLIDMDDVNASATNFLAISVNTTATTHKVYGGYVTIAIVED